MTRCARSSVADGPVQRARLERLAPESQGLVSELHARVGSIRGRLAVGVRASRRARQQATFARQSASLQPRLRRTETVAFKNLRTTELSAHVHRLWFRWRKAQLLDRVSRVAREASAPSRSLWASALEFLARNTETTQPFGQRVSEGNHLFGGERNEHDREWADWKIA